MNTKPKLYESGNWGCPVCEEVFDANDDWMATKFKHHMVVHARRGET